MLSFKKLRQLKKKYNDKNIKNVPILQKYDKP